MDIIVNILIVVSLLAVVITFLLGMVSFSKQTQADQKQSNVWMAWRVRTQIAAIAILMLSLWLKTQG
jgi:hypothetical protein